MSKKVKKGKNAQKKKTQRNKQNMGVRSSAVSVAQQRAMYEEEEPRAELGAGVKARAQGTTMPLGVRILVGIMAFTMLTMMGVVSYSSLNNFDLVDWLTGEDVAPGTSSSTNSASAMTREQRAAVDATNKFDGFFVLDEDSGLSITDVNSGRQTANTREATTKYKEETEKKRDEILEADKEKIQSLKDKKASRDEAKQNNPFKKFSDGIGQFRDAVVALFSNTYDGLTGKNRAESSDYNGSELNGENLNTVDSASATDYNADTAGTDATTDTADPNESGDEKPADDEKVAAPTDTKPLNEALADANGLATKSGTKDKTLAEDLNATNS